MDVSVVSVKRSYRDSASLITEPVVEAALQDADVFFGSMIFDYDQVLWLHKRRSHLPTTFDHIRSDVAWLLGKQRVVGWALPRNKFFQGCRVYRGQCPPYD